MQIEMESLAVFAESQAKQASFEETILELPITKTVMVYNPASIDSVITTAVIAARGRSGEEVTCLPSSDYLLRDQFERYDWVGVYPSKHTLSKWLKNKSHHGLLKHKPQYEDLFRTVTTVHRDPEVPSSETLLEAFTHKQEYDSNYWRLAFAVSEIEKCQNVSLEDQAFVYANYQHARICIANKIPYEPLFFKEEWFTDYLKQLKTLKMKISEIWNYTVLQIDGKAVRIPVINLGSEVAPWAIKVISCSYNHAVTFEQVRGKTIYTVFSRTAGFREVFEKCLVRQTESLIQFSGEL